MHTESDLAAATPDPAVSHQQVPGAGPEIQGRPPDAATHQVVVGDIPVEPSGYLPRAALLAELDRADARVAVIRAATGLRGLGATQLAAAYARTKLEAGWRLVAWVNGADTGSLLAGLAAVADATGLADEDSGLDRTDPAGTVRHWLETDGDRCLLVFDDVSDPEVLRALVPAHGAARVLITTTRKSAANLGSAVPIDVFSAAEASAFLTRRTGLDDEVGAAAVATALGHLPLALALPAPLARRRAGGAAVSCDDPGGRQDGHGRAGHGDHRGAVVGWGQPRATAHRRAGGRAGRRRASGSGGPGGSGAGVVARLVAPDVQPRWPDHRDAPPGGAGSP